MLNCWCKGASGEVRVTGAGKILVLNRGEAQIRRSQSVAAGEVSDGPAKELGIVGDVIEIDAYFEIMAAVPWHRRQIEVRDSLPACCRGLLGEVIVSARRIRVHEVGVRAVRNVVRVILVEGESGFEKFSVGKVMLVFDAGDVSGFVVLRIGELRALRGKKGVLIVEMIDQETGSEDVAVGEVGLELG